MIFSSLVSRRWCRDLKELMIIFCPPEGSVPIIVCNARTFFRRTGSHREKAHVC